MSFFQNLFGKKKESLHNALYKTRTSAFSKILNFLKGRQQLDTQTIEDLEQFLIAADVGTETTFYLLEQLEKNTHKNQDAVVLLKEEIQKIFARSFDYSQNTPLLSAAKPYVILVVGINGVGKTTSIAKLMHLYKSEKKEILLGAADTFRAAAIEQLEKWAQRLNVPIIKREQGADPASVAYDSLKSGIAKDKDIVLIDTAGRLHTKQPLMEELGKIQRTLQKIQPDTPQEVLLVLDGATGQNVLRQVQEFAAITAVSGLIVTKLDGSSKGGLLINLAHHFKIPIRYIGVGEQPEDLLFFNPNDYIETLFSEHNPDAR